MSDPVRSHTISDLIPAEQIALTVGLAQVLRGDQPTPGVATVCVLALARLTGKHDYLAHGSDEPVTQPEVPYGHAMLPNDSHPGAGCSCADCLRNFK